MADFDVLVVGAGPTGLFLAAELARHGVRPRLIDQQPRRSPYSRALGIQARTLEVIDQAGVVAPFLERGLRIHGANMYAGGRRIVHLAFDELETPYPFILSLPQDETEEILTDHARRAGVEIEREVRLTALEQDDESVTAALDRRGQVELARARYLVGCDGAHSIVRKQSGILYTGEDIDSPFALADVQVDWDLPHEEGHAFFSPKGVAVFLPLPGEGRYRIILDLEAGEPPPEATLDLFKNQVEIRAHVEAALSDPRWLATFSIRQRRASAYRAGRVFIAGDAAHCHSPVGGQGMNTGIQDAHNLAWKLALVLKGAGRKRLLSSYEAERAPIAESVIKNTAAGTKVVALRHPVTQEVRNRLAGFLSSFDVVQQRIARGTGELDVSYRESPIVGEERSSFFTARIAIGPDRSTESPTISDWRAFGAGPRAGDRVPDVELADGRRLFDLMRGTRHTLLLFDGEASTEDGYRRMAAAASDVRSARGEHVNVVIVVPKAERPAALEWDGPIVLEPQMQLHKRFGHSAEGLVLVRPDGYVGYRAMPVDAARLRTYLDLLFR